MRPVACRSSSRRRRSRRSGFTILEAVVAAGIVVLLTSVLAMASARARDHHRVGQVRVDLNSRAARTLDRVCDELAYAEASQMDPQPLPPFGASLVEYRRCAGYQAGGVRWEPLARIALELESGEVDDGRDNDGDGLVDEHRLVLTRDVGLATEHRVVLCNGVAEYLEGEVPDGDDDNGNGLVDERGFSISIEGGVVALRLTVEGFDHERRTHVLTHETAILVRN